MIIYKKGCKHFIPKLFHWRGSVFPSAVAAAMPSCLCTMGIRLLVQKEFIPDFLGEDRIFRDSAVWGGFTFLVGFLIVFRTSQAYTRFWDGCTAAHTMRVELFGACSTLIAFCRYEKSYDHEQNMSFQHLIVRLFSMLHAAALAEIEDCGTEDMENVEAFRYPLLDARGLDRQSLQVVMQCDTKVELLLQWIQQLIIDHINCGVLSIPAPLLSRSMQELFNGVIAFHDAVKVASIPFPFPYSQICDILLVMHWIGTPIVTAQWVVSPVWAGIFCFVQVFIYVCLNLIATEIENPFGRDPNDIDGEVMQNEMNRHLLLLLEPSTKRTPTLRKGRRTREHVNAHSLMDAWKMDFRDANGTVDSFNPGPNLRPRQVGFRRSETKDSKGLKGTNLQLLRHNSSHSVDDTVSEPCTPPLTPAASMTLDNLRRGRSLVSPVHSSAGLGRESVGSADTTGPSVEEHPEGSLDLAQGSPPADVDGNGVGIADEGDVQMPKEPEGQEDEDDDDDVEEEGLQFSFRRDITPNFPLSEPDEDNPIHRPSVESYPSSTSSYYCAEQPPEAARASTWSAQPTPQSLADLGPRSLALGGDDFSEDSESVSGKSEQLADGVLTRPRRALGTPTPPRLKIAINGRLTTQL